MHQIRIQSIKNPTIYRIVQVSESMSLFDLDTVISTAFSIEDESDVFFEFFQVKGKKSHQVIPLYSESYDEFESLEETVGEWFVKIDDGMDYMTEAGIKLKLTLEKVIEIEDVEACIIDGQGDLFSKRKNIDIDALNKVLQLEMELDRSLFSEIEKGLMDNLFPDYLTLFEVADEFKKLKPWQYFNNEDIIAVQLNDMKYFISVMGAGGQEYGLMMYDEAFGYQSLEKIINGEALSDDFSIDMSALTVNYVDRDELDKEDYELIKEHGLSFRGKKNWIAFKTFEPGFVPMQPDYDEVETMIELIELMIQVTKMRMSGWEYPMVPMYGYPLFEVQNDGEVDLLGIIEMERIEDWVLEIDVNDLEVAKIKKKQKSPLEIEFDYFYMPYAVDGEEERPLYPLINIIVNHTTGEVIHHEIVPFRKHSFVQQLLFWNMLKDLAVLPSKIFVSAEVCRILMPVAKLVGIELVVSELPNVDEFREMLKFNPPF
ncbi:hypothetical protein MKZ25_15750 [Solibacillus sp. FSL W7-1464]|uniref:DUF7309 domain-containing protein n=1 Tax=unclassified Solibacillus TaxID=2637870 RepID=UPI0030FB0951